MIMSTVTRDSVSSPVDYEAISPYLRRPLRSLREYLKERSRSRNQPDPAVPPEAGEPTPPGDQGQIAPTDVDGDAKQ